jgi:RimJ/RimL family protein N-acetyltransferase
MPILTTQRLRLEPFNDTHLEGLFILNSDPQVMRYITGKPDTREETMAGIARIKARWVSLGYSWWSFIELETNEIIGAGCIQHLGQDPVNPLEIGWRLRSDKWQQGFASEAANKMAAYAFDTLGADLLCAICDQENTASSHVMKKLGMHFRGIERWHDMDNAVYEMSAGDWKSRTTA